MLRWYYLLRKRMGLAEIATERLRQHHLLHPEEDSEESLRKEDALRLKQVLLGLAVILVLTGASALQNRTRFFTTLTRPGFGDVPREVTLDLELTEREYEIPVSLDSLRYTEEELEAKFEEAWMLAQKKALGKNPDWEHLTSQLDFSEETGVKGITVNWTSSDVDVISVNGELAEPKNGFHLSAELTATLCFEEQNREYKVQALVMAPELTGNEAEERALKDLLQEAVADRSRSEIRLPGEWKGESILYKEETGGIPLWLIPALGIPGLAALWFLPEQRRREEMTKRNRELALGYSELVWKLTVLMGAGMTVKGAWDRILRVYRDERRRGLREPSVLYEEMQITWNSMGQGVYEEKAYAEFGRRCGLQTYLRLGSLLETNVRQGRKGLAVQLQREADAAFQDRLQLAKRQGEEASSKLLMPMMMLFALVMVILMVPALTSFV